MATCMLTFVEKIQYFGNFEWDTCDDKLIILPIK